MHQQSDSGIYLTCFNTPDVYLMLNTNSFVSRKHDSHTYHKKKKLFTCNTNNGTTRASNWSWLVHKASRQ
jgi:hypothetical protein